MTDGSDRLLRLRPVKFRYKQPNSLGEKPIQYGLIAEEVAEVFPELVVPNANGEPETVAYHILPALLLNEYQKQHQELQTANQQLETEHQLNQEQSEKLLLLQQQIDAQSAQLVAVDLLRAKLAKLERLAEILAATSGIDPTKIEDASQMIKTSEQPMVAAR